MRFVGKHSGKGIAMLSIFWFVSYRIRERLGVAMTTKFSF